MIISVRMAIVTTVAIKKINFIIDIENENKCNAKK